MLYLCTRKQTKSGAKVKNESLELKLRTGCSSVRLEYASGGRVVAGSNPVIPTTKWFYKISRTIFCFSSTPFSTPFEQQLRSTQPSFTLEQL